MVESISPTLFLQIENLSRALFENVRNMNSQFEREVLGIDLIKTAAESYHLHRQSERENMEARKTGKRNANRLR